MKIKEYFENIAKTGRWQSLYDQKTDMNNYNFLTRRDQVNRLLKSDDLSGHMLDLGCGTGDYVEIAHQHNLAFHGLDFSPAMLIRAQADKVNKNRDALVLAAGDFIPYRDDTFSLVIGVGYIEYFNDPHATLCEINRVLKPGGILVLQSHHVELVGGVSKLVSFPFKWLFRMASRSYRHNPKDRPEVVIRYSKAQLDRLVSVYGFALADYGFNNFFISPTRIRGVSPRFSIMASNIITKLCPKLLGFLALNYIGKYVIDKPITGNVQESVRTDSRISSIQ